MCMCMINYKTEEEKYLTALHGIVLTHTVNSFSVKLTKHPFLQKKKNDFFEAYAYAIRLTERI